MEFKDENIKLKQNDCLVLTLEQVVCQENHLLIGQSGLKEMEKFFDKHLNY